jgi:hypothetical protein
METWPSETLFSSQNSSQSPPLLPLILPLPSLNLPSVNLLKKLVVVCFACRWHSLSWRNYLLKCCLTIRSTLPLLSLLSSLFPLSFHDSRSTLLQLQRSLPPTNSPARLLLPGQRQRPQQIQTATTMMALSFLLVTNHLLSPPRATSTHLVHTPLMLSLTNQSPLSLSPLRSLGWSVSLRLLVLCRRFKC